MAVPTCHGESQLNDDAERRYRDRLGCPEQQQAQDAEVGTKACLIAVVSEAKVYFLRLSFSGDSRDRGSDFRRQLVPNGDQLTWCHVLPAMFRPAEQIHFLTT